MKKILVGIFTAILFGHFNVSTVLWAQDEVNDPFESAEPVTEGESPFNKDEQPSSNATSPFEEESNSPDSPFAASDNTTTKSPFEQAPSDAPSSPFEQAPSSDVTSPFEQSPSDAPSSPFEQAPSGEVTSPFENTPQNDVISPFQDMESQFDAVVDPFSDSGETSDDIYTPPIQRESVNIKGVYIVAAQEGLNNIGEITQLSEDITNAELNTLFIETKTAGGTAYSSDLTPSQSFIAPGFESPILDLKTQLHGSCSLIAVVDILPAYSATISGFPSDNHPLGQNPDMICYSLKGDRIAEGNTIFMDPGSPEVQDFLENLVLEIEDKVSPDGYLFRGLKYPGANWGYSPKAVEAFRNTVGGEGPPPPDHPVWSAWRRQQLTNLLSNLKQTIQKINPDSIIAVEVDTQAFPPKTWRQWMTSTTYSENMQDWITWCQDGLLDQIVFNVFERNNPQGNTLASWVHFVNSNTYGTKPVISINGSLNFTRGFTRQMETVRSRGTGIIIYQYSDPIRSQSRGFYQGLPNLVFRNASGHPIPGNVIRGNRENRQFSMMQSPPIAAILPTPTPLGYEVVRESDLLNFATPTPIPTPTPPPSFIPSGGARKITLKSGMEVEADVLEVTPGTITLQPLNGAPMILSRRVIESIVPPLE